MVVPPFDSLEMVVFCISLQAFVLNSDLTILRRIQVEARHYHAQLKLKMLCDAEKVPVFTSSIKPFLMYTHTHT